MEPSEPETATEVLDEYTSCASMSYEQRMYGFAFCALFGACVRRSRALWRPTKFATLYSMGNVLSLASTGFLTGFGRQLKNMFHGTRFVATCVYLGSLIMTLVRAVELKSFPLTILFLAIQWCALMWYCMSYIPGGRAMLKGLVKACCGGSGGGDDFFRSVERRAADATSRVNEQNVNKPSSARALTKKAKEECARSSRDVR